MEKYFTVQEVADSLKVSSQTVRNWITSGELKALKLKYNVRITEKDLKEFIEKNN
mgnify:CR=1 FL=1